MPSFVNLWSNYPTMQRPCDGRWLNQCAIRMSLALNAEGSITVDSVTYTEPNVPMDMPGGLSLWRIGYGDIIWEDQQFILMGLTPNE